MVKRNNKMGENNNGQQNIFCVEDIITRVICYCLPLDTKCGAVTQTSEAVLRWRSMQIKCYNDIKFINK